MIPAGLIGTIIGYYTFSFFEEKHLKLIIGFIGLFFTLNYYIKINKEIIKQNTSTIKGSFWSIASGFAAIIIKIIVPFRNYHFYLIELVIAYR